jgi:hypothetical protein
MSDARQNIVDWAKWGVEHHGQANYTEGPTRMEGVHKPGVLPFDADCSAFFTYCYSWGGAADPNGQGYNGTGYTGTLLAHGTEIPLEQVQPGDAIVYGPGTGDHVAMVVEAGPDPLTVSHGQQGDPNYCRVSQDGRQPQRYLRFDTTNINNGTSPYAPSPNPSKETPMAVTQVITDFKPGLQHVIQISGGVLYHKWRNTDGKWTNEVLAGPQGGSAKVTAKFVGQPQVAIAGQQMVITAEADNGAVFYFAQSVNGTTWGAVQLP